MRDLGKERDGEGGDREISGVGERYGEKKGD